MPLLLTLESDASGAFAGTLQASIVVGPLRVVATAPEPIDPRADGLADLGYGGSGSSTAPLLCRSTMPTAMLAFELASPEARENLVALELVLAPRATITGTVFGRDGAPLVGLGRANRAAPSEIVRGASGWPEGASLGFAGIGGARLGATKTVDGYDQFAGPTHTTQPLQPVFLRLRARLRRLVPARDRGPVLRRRRARARLRAATGGHAARPHHRRESGRVCRAPARR